MARLTLGNHPAILEAEKHMASAIQSIDKATACLKKATLYFEKQTNGAAVARLLTAQGFLQLAGAGARGALTAN